ncbi:MAG TPA: S8 family serine peptidase [Bdellovibrionales bacterium]|nr:S8 family serine peptidase [Bdellovibrionales bacterium]
MPIIEQHAQLVDGYGPIEYFEPVFKILQLATAKGIHCVAAGGNGGENLDHPKFQGAFDISKRDSGCMLVGAAEPPTGSQARERSYFSSYGARIDAYGYGNGVVTSGYGDMFSGEIDGKLASYTADFSGTSSATPIVAGAVASVLGMAKAKGVVITPAQMREALRATGTPQGGAATERIGNLPDLRQLVTRFFGPQL